MTQLGLISAKIDLKLLVEYNNFINISSVYSSKRYLQRDAGMIFLKVF